MLIDVGIGKVSSAIEVGSTRTTRAKFRGRRSIRAPVADARGTGRRATLPAANPSTKTPTSTALITETGPFPTSLLLFFMIF